MKAIVVYESLFGNSAAIARAIAEGLGPEAQVLTTAQATGEAVAGADLIVAGAPVHSLSLPTEGSRDWARTGSLGPGGAAPDLSHPAMRSWLATLPVGKGRSAVFETCVNAWYGRGAASKILSGLKSAGYRATARPQRFYVGGHPLRPTADGSLCEGEVERARQWGASLARTMAGLNGN